MTSFVALINKTLSDLLTSPV